MIGQKNVTHLLIGKDLDILTDGANIKTLADGQIAAREVGSSVSFTGSASGKKFQMLYKKAGGDVIESPVIDFSKITNKDYKDYTAPVEQLDFIGFNGANGSIDVQNNIDYRVAIGMKFLTKLLGTTTEYVYGEYTSGSSATEAGIAAGIAASLTCNMSEQEDYLSFYRIVNDAGTAITGTGDLTVSEGSKIISAATDADAVLAVGDALRIGTAVTDSTYIITAIDATNDLIYIDVPYQGVDAVIAEASAEYVAAATVATASWGVAIQALKLATEQGLFFFDKVTFSTQFREGFDDTTLTKSALPIIGNGSAEQVSTTEYFLEGNRGEAYRVRDYPLSKNYQTVAGETYDEMSVSSVDTTQEHIGTLTRPMTLVIAIPEGGSNNIEASLKTMFGL